MKTDKELYRELRVLSCEKLWNDVVPQFDRASPEERAKRVAIVRAVGVVFSESGTPKQKAEVKSWLVRLLEERPHAKITLNVNGALTELLIHNHHQDVIEKLLLLFIFLELSV